MLFKMLLLIFVVVVILVVATIVLFKHEIADAMHKREMSEREKSLRFELIQLERERDNMSANAFSRMEIDEVEREIQKIKNWIKEEKRK